MSNSNEFSDLGKMHISETDLIPAGEKDKKGCFVSNQKAILLVVLVLALCAIVGVAVYFAHPDKGKGGESSSSDTSTASTTRKPTQTSPTQSIQPQDIFLPTDVMPVRYNVRIRPDIYSDSPANFNFNGTMEMIFRVKINTNMVVLHYRSLEIDYSSITVHELPSMSEIQVDVSNINTRPSPLEFLQIPTRSTLISGRNYKIKMSYQGPLKKDLTGIYYSDYLAEDGSTVYLLTSQLQATDARKVFPCMDEPALKAIFDVVIERRETKHSKSNTMISHSENMTDGWIADYYEPTPIMSPYLLAFLVSDFECVHDYSSSGKLVEICARPTAINQTEFAMSIAVDMQEWFSQYHYIDYPLNKTTHVAVPDFAAGAMENWGLIVYRETALLFDPLTSSARNKQYVAIVVSHELAHMWFGNLVTMQWWDDVWLNEGFASYMELWGIHNVKDFNTWKMEDQFVVQYMQSVMVDDSLVTSHPVYLPVNNPLQIGQLFDEITYSKGASIIRMMKYFLGEQTFRSGLSNYLNDRLYQVAGHADLFSFLTTEWQQHARYGNSGLNVSDIMNTWILQMGYPVVTFNYETGSSVINLTQRHFLLDPTLNVTQVSPYGYQWMVPISYMTELSGVPDLDNLTLQWLDMKTGSIENVETNIKWVIGNVGETFYYRVNYNAENWNALAEQLKNNHNVIPTVNRAQLLDDSFMLGRSGDIEQVLAFEISTYMSGELEYPPWYAMSTNIRYVSLMLQQSSGNELLQAYMQEQVNDIYQRLGWNEKANESHLDKLLRSIILSLACGYRLEACLQYVNTTFTELMEAEKNNETYQINPNFASIIYCNGVSGGGIEEWEFAYQMFLKSNSGAEKNALLVAMSCTKVSWILQRYLQWALEEDQHGIGKQDMLAVLISVARNPVSTHIAWNFFKANWNTFFERFGAGAFTLSYMVRSMTETFSSQWELSDLQRFVAANSNLGTAERAFQQSIESTMANMKWRQQNERDVVNWLRFAVSK